MTTIQLIPVAAGKEMPPEPVDGVEAIFARLETLAHMHAEDLTSQRQQWDEEERETRVGYSIELNSDLAESPLTIHAIDDGCVVMGKVHGRLRLTVGSLESEEIVAFLHPEWIEFELSELNSYEFTKQVVADWIKDGRIKEEYLRAGGVTH